jgi:hypothetical protein
MTATLKTKSTYAYQVDPFSFQDVQLLANDGSRFWTSQALLAINTFFKMAFKDNSAEENLMISVDYSSEEVKMLLDFIHKGLVPFSFGEQNMRIFKTFGVSFKDKKFSKVVMQEIKLEVDCLPEVIVSETPEEVFEPMDSESTDDASEVPMDAEEPIPETRKVQRKQIHDPKPELDAGTVQEKTLHQESETRADEKKSVDPESVTGTVFSNGITYKTYGLMQTKVRIPGPCLICKKEYSDLPLHMFKSHNKEHSSCEICGKTFTNKSSWGKHKNAAHEYVL